MKTEAQIQAMVGKIVKVSGPGAKELCGRRSSKLRYYSTRKAYIGTLWWDRHSLIANLAGNNRISIRTLKNLPKGY